MSSIKKNPSPALLQRFINYCQQISRIGTSNSVAEFFILRYIYSFALPMTVWR